MRFLMIFQYKTKCKEIFIISEIYLVFHPQNEGPSCLQGACGCLNTNIYKSAAFFMYFLTNIVLKIPPYYYWGGKSIGPQPSFSRKCGTGKLNQTDG